MNLGIASDVYKIDTSGPNISHPITAGAIQTAANPLNLGFSAFPQTFSVLYVTSSSDGFPFFYLLFSLSSTFSTSQFTSKMSKTFTPAEVASHKTADAGLYIIIDSSVYDVTNFVDEHPGGAKILKRVAGKDASKQFWKVCIPSFFFFLLKMLWLL